MVEGIMENRPHIPDGRRADSPCPLRLAVLAQSARVSGGHSVGKNLLAALGRAGPDVRFFLALHADAGLEDLGWSLAGDRVALCRRRDFVGRWQWETFTLGRRLREFAPHVVLDLGSRGLADPPCPQAILCQRAQFFYPPDCWPGEPLKFRLLFRLHVRRFRRALARTDLVLCQTPVAERRFRDWFGYRGGSAICPNALSEDVRQAPRDAPPPASLAALGERFKLLCVSRWFPHKNLEALIEVFRRHGRDLPDVVAVTTVSPGDHPRAAGFLRAIRAPDLAGRIVNVGGIRQEELASYYRACQAAILPTLLESFSGTYLEAMHFGVPILTSDRDFAREVCGEAACYFDPLDAATVRDAILAVRSEPARAAALVEAGRRRLAAMPTWDDIARDLLARLREIAAR